MKLLRVRFIRSDTCGGLLNGLDVQLRNLTQEIDKFSPLCLIGPNGAGKSQFLQGVAEIFQSLFHAVVPSDETVDANASLAFEIEYLIRPAGRQSNMHVRAIRSAGKGRSAVEISRNTPEGWVRCDVKAKATQDLLPSLVVGYTSGDNETLSLPFLISRSGYADEVARRALDRRPSTIEVPDRRLMFLDY